MFLNQAGTTFRDLSGLSGADSIKDSRTFVVWDYDRDGWQDIALININAPVLQLFRNQMGDGSDDRSGNILAVRCVGGQKTDAPSTEFSPRDGIGAKVVVKVGDATLLRELHCGEGFAAQNSNTLVFGLGAAEKADSVTIRWPSGKEQTVQNIAENSLLTFFEDHSEGNRQGVTTEPYRGELDRNAWTRTDSRRESLDFRADESQTAELVMYTSMATWCEACREHLPELTWLRSRFEQDELAIFGVPVDLQDTPDKLDRYVKALTPAYELLDHLGHDKRTHYAEFVTGLLHKDALPTTVITDSSGRVWHVQSGVPSYSDIRKLQQQMSR